jgi:microcystin-dependent protein
MKSLTTGDFIMLGKIPLGTIMLYAGDDSASSVISLLISGWLLCDGSKYNRTSSQFSALFSVIGESFGGDNNDFCVPMCRGLFLRGVTGNSNTDPDAALRTSARPDLPIVGNKGADVGSMQSDAYQTHSHSYNVYADTRNQDHVAAHDTINNQPTSSLGTSSQGGHETRPTNIYANFIINFTPDNTAIPIGTIVPYAGTLPNVALAGTGWLACDGSGLLTNKYADLNNVIESFYGADNLTFYLPDYRGLFVRGMQGTPLRGVQNYDPDANTRTPPTSYPIPGNSGNSVGSKQSDVFMLHQHSYSYNDAYQWTAATLIGFDGVAQDLSSTDYNTSTVGSSESRPVNMYVNYLIKAEKVS